MEGRCGLVNELGGHCRPSGFQSFWGRTKSVGQGHQAAGKMKGWDVQLTPPLRLCMIDDCCVAYVLRFQPRRAALCKDQLRL